MGCLETETIGSLWGTYECVTRAIVKFPIGNNVAKRFRNVIGPRVRAWRVKRGLTQAELALRLQLHGWTTIDRVGVAKIESGIRSVFDYETILLSRALDVSPGAFSPEDADFDKALPRLVPWDGK